MVLDKIIEILADYLADSDIDEDTMIFMEYDLDDDDINEIIVLIQDEFDVEIDPESFCELSCVAEIAEYVESLVLE